MIECETGIKIKIQNAKRGANEMIIKDIKKI